MEINKNKPKQVEPESIRATEVGTSAEPGIIRLKFQKLLK